MERTPRIELNFRTPDGLACARAFTTALGQSLEPMSSVRVDDKPAKVSTPETAWGRARRSLSFIVKEAEPRYMEFILDKSRSDRNWEQASMFFARAGWTPTAPELLASLAATPFDTLSNRSISMRWGSGLGGYRSPGFDEGHFDHGWICAFKGEGHARLVSPRWLEFGPWRVLRGAEDVTIVQFHDDQAEDDEALAQARPGHQRMGISDEGGFLQYAPSSWWEYPSLRSLYDAAARILTVVVAGRTVSQGEMLEACYYRLLQPLEKPVDNVAFVFMDEANARAHLHELWLRGLECRVIRGASEVRLDLDYHPTPTPPDWVRRVQDREGC